MPNVWQTLKQRPLLLIGLIITAALLIVFSPLLIVLLLAKTGGGVLLLKSVKFATNTFDARNLQSTPPGLADAMLNSETACFRNSDCTFGPCVKIPTSLTKAVNHQSLPTKIDCTPPQITIMQAGAPEFSYTVCTKNQCTKQSLIDPKKANSFSRSYVKFLTTLFPFMNPQ